MAKEGDTKAVKHLRDALGGAAVLARWARKPTGVIVRKHRTPRRAVKCPLSHAAAGDDGLADAPDRQGACAHMPPVPVKEKQKDGLLPHGAVTLAKVVPQGIGIGGRRHRPLTDGEGVKLTKEQKELLRKLDDSLDGKSSPKRKKFFDTLRDFFD